MPSKNSVHISLGFALSAVVVCLSQSAFAASLPAENPPGVVPGLFYRYFESDGNYINDIEVGALLKEGVINNPDPVAYPPPNQSNFDLAPRLRDPNIGFRYWGYINVPDTGTYTFFTNSDDGSKLYIGPNMVQVVDNDGPHGMVERSGTIDLDAGLHQIMVLFKQGAGGYGLEVRYQGPTQAKNAIQNAQLFTYTSLAATPVISGTPNLTTLPATVSITCATPNSTIYYTTDGTVPGMGSPRYTNPVSISAPTNFKAVAYAAGVGPSSVATAFVDGLRTPENPANTQAGLFYQVRHIAGGTGGVISPSMETLPVTKSGATPIVDIAVRDQDTDVFIKWTGYLTVPTDGVYTLYTASDDGSLFYVGNRLVVSNNFSQGVIERSGQIGLKAGTHAISISWANGGGAFGMNASYQGPGINKQVISAAAYKTDPILPVVTFSPNGGNFSGSQNVTMNCADPLARILYTVDGTNPTELSYNGEYSTPVTITQSTTFKAAPFRTGFISPGVSTAAFVRTDLGPALSSVIASGNANLVLVTFDRAVDPGTATVGANYSFTPVGTIIVQGTPTLDADGKTVRVPVTSMIDTFSYTLTVANVQDTNGNAIPASGVSMTFKFFAKGSIAREFWQNINGANNIALLLTAPTYPNEPSGGSLQTAFFEAPINWADNYGTRMRGYFYPPTSGDYTFAISCDDPGQLFVSTDDKPENKIMVASVPDGQWSNSREWLKHATQLSAKIMLDATKRYYVEAVQKEGQGGDNLAVLATTAAAVLNADVPIAGANMSPYIEPLRFIFQPQDRTVQANNSATFSVQLVGSGPRTYQWQRDLNNIAGASNATLTLPNVTLADNGSTYRVIVTNYDGTVISNTATLTVIDSLPPVLTSAFATSSLGVQLNFNEPIDPGATIANFSIDQGVSVQSVTVNGSTVNLTTTAMCVGLPYVVTITGLKDAQLPPNATGVIKTTVTPADDYTSGMLAYWKYDEGAGNVAIDSTLTGHDGSLINGPAYSQGKYNTGLTHAASSYMVAPAVGNFRSVSMWLNTTTKTQQQIFDAGTTGVNNQGFQIGLSNGGVSGNPPVNTPGVFFAAIANDLYIPIDLTDGVWHNVILTWNGTNSVFIAVDGKYPQGYVWNGGTWTPTLQTQPFTMYANIIQTQQPVQVGLARAQIRGAGNAFFTGMIDDVRMYNAQLTDAQIQAIYRYDGNHAPAVSAGPNVVINTPNYKLQGSVSDDGLPPAVPPGETIPQWSQISGPGTVTFTPNSNTPDAVANFPAPGVYRLRLTASDGPYTSCSDVTITVTGPTVLSVTPAIGPMSGGTDVTIHGGYLNGATAVFFGTTQAATPVVTDISGDTTITTKSPPHAAGKVDVVVRTPGGDYTLTNGFEYVKPTITAINPTSGPIAGGQTVTITGTTLQGAQTVKFGTEFANIVAGSNTDSEVKVTTPSQLAGTTVVDVTLTTVGGTDTKTNAYTYVAAPVVSTVAPNAGKTAGGDTITITGTNLSNAIVNIGSIDVVPFTNSDTQITLPTPPHVAGLVDVIVTTIGGIGSKLQAFRYLDAPTITNLNPDNGPMIGSSVTINGTNLGVGAVVTIDGANATITNSSDAQLVVNAPPHAAGFVQLVVTTPGGIAQADYTYVGPEVTLISPDRGPLAGNQSIILIGTRLTGATVKIDGTTTATSNASDTSITITTPAHGAAEAVDVTVTTAEGEWVGVDAYIYLNAPQNLLIAPDRGPIAGGQQVTIFGENLGDLVSVEFDGTMVTPTDASDTSITVLSPLRATASVVDVVVTTYGGSATVQYTYLDPPTITSVTPNKAPIGGNIAVVIAGSNLSGATAVTFGGTPVVSIASNTATQINVTIPAHAAGTVTVAVTAPNGTGSLPNGFTYVQPPVVTSITPGVGPAGGGQNVTISGTGFVAGAIVRLGASSLTNVNVASATSITGTTAAGTPGLVDVIVQNADLQSGLLSNAYRFNGAPTLPSLATISSETLAGKPVTITVPTPNDPEGDVVTVTFDWGDGSPVDGNSTHTYAAEGSYTAQVILSDGINTVVVQTFPLTIGSPPPFTLLKLLGAFKFTTTGQDSCALSGILPNIAQGFEFTNRKVKFNVGGAQSEFTLDGRGRAKTANGTFALKAKFVKDKATGKMVFVGGPVGFSTSFKKGTWSDDWANEGVDPTKDFKNQEITMPADLIFDGSTFSVKAKPKLTSKKSKGGSFKQ